ncbi:MAG: hypothetical protein JF604_23035, partial [Bradyrhizobium sp.]|nr:hypothetical protein [Bradyrhizobium sp.]
MSAQIVLLPVFVLAIFGLVVLLLSARGRTGAEPGSRAAGTLDLQLLFYTLIALALPLRHADLLIVLLSWVFVIAWIVSTGLVSAIDDNRRSLARTAGALVLLVMWIYFALRIL